MKASNYFASDQWRRVKPALICFLSALMLALPTSPIRAQGATSPATFTQPLDGAFFDPSRTIRWTEQPGALSHYLYVGTTPGAKDIINSGETLSTEWPGLKLPAGTTVYARIHTRYPTGWVYSDITFAVQPMAVITSQGTRSLVNPIHTFEWTTVPGAEAYYLYVGSEPGMRDLVNSGEIQSTSYVATGLPTGRTIHVRLHTRHGGIWRSVDETLDVASLATFIAPLDRARGIDPELQLRWREVEGADSYYLYVGTAPGLKDIVNSGETKETSWPATFIPAGETVYARLHTRFNGSWKHTDISFQLAPKAVFIEPTADGEEIDARAPLLWTEVPTALAYYLYVGSAPGAKDLINSGEIQELSFDISALPRGQELHATLHTKADDGWRQTQRSFRLIGVVATLEDRPDAPSNIDVRVPLKWIGVEGAQAYRLIAGTTAGANDLLDSGEIQGTQYSIETLPAGQTVHIRLYTRHGNVWRQIDAVLATRPVSYLQGAPADSGIWQPSVPLAWTALPGADMYYVYVGSTPGAMDISNSGAISGTEYSLPPHHAAAIQSDRTLYVRLHTLKDGMWRYVDYILHFKVAASLTFPTPGASGVDVTSLRLTWHRLEGATRYRLQLGSTPGSDDILSGGDTQSLDYRVNSLPGGRTIFARLWTEVSGEWRYTESTFSTRPVSTLLQPAFGQTNADLEMPLVWSAVDDASMYRVEMGSFAGGSDLLDSGPTSETSTPIPSSITTESGVIYVRVWTRHEGTWRFADSFFSTGGPAEIAMEWASEQDAFLAGDGFRWAASPLVESYRLLLGTAPGSNNLHDSGRIRTTRRLVENLPEGVELYGTLESGYYDGSTDAVQFQFTVEVSSIDFAERWNQALWITGEVRRMARDGNAPLPDSLLQDFARIQQVESAFCTTYSLAFVELARQMNLGADTRRLSVCLNSNGYDCHSLNEVRDSVTGRWRLLDPTFGMAMRQKEGGEWLTAMDMLTAAREGSFDSVEYMPQTSNGLSYAENYYLDYPLLFAKILAPESNTVIESIGSVLQFYDFTGLSSVSTPGLYAIRCLGPESSTWVSIDGANTAVSCPPVSEGLSHVFGASTISPTDSSPPYEVAIPRRIVFH